MSDLPAKLDLVGVAEIADMAGATKTSVSNWKKKWDDFPKPVADLRAGPVFWRAEVEVWLLKRLQKPNIKGYLRQSANANAQKEKLNAESQFEIFVERPGAITRENDTLDRAISTRVKRPKSPPKQMMAEPVVSQPTVQAESAKTSDQTYIYPRNFKPGMIITEDDLK